jgi:hypothetical protein
MKGLMFVVALAIGFVAYNAAQRYWVSAMQTRMDDIAASPNKDWLPPAQPVTVDTSQMNRMLNSPSALPGLNR